MVGSILLIMRLLDFTFRNSGANIIWESERPFTSPIVVMKKKKYSIRLCVDYRKLNNQTIKDAYALPNTEETFSALTGSKWFSVMDLKPRYYQVEVEEDDKYKTVFVTHGILGV